MKPMIFQVSKVFNEFKRKGEIASYRREFPEDTEYWIRKTGNSEKEFEARLVGMIRVDEGDPIPFKKSHDRYPTGFGNPRDWYLKVMKMYDGKVPDGWILYLERTTEDDTQ